jgi:hypothetical protein
MPANLRLKLTPVEHPTFRELSVNTVPAQIQRAIELRLNAYGPNESKELPIVHI